jgi:hypothetical protein
MAFSSVSAQLKRLKAQSKYIAIRYHCVRECALGQLLVLEGDTVAFVGSTLQDLRPRV